MIFLTIFFQKKYLWLKNILILRLIKAYGYEYKHKLTHVQILSTFTK